MNYTFRLNTGGYLPLSVFHDFFRATFLQQTFLILQSMLGKQDSDCSKTWLLVETKNRKNQEKELCTNTETE